MHGQSSAPFDGAPHPGTLEPQSTGPSAHGSGSNPHDKDIDRSGQPQQQLLLLQLVDGCAGKAGGLEGAEGSRERHLLATRLPADGAESGGGGGVTERAGALVERAGAVVGAGAGAGSGTGTGTGAGAGAARSSNSSGRAGYSGSADNSGSREASVQSGDNRGRWSATATATATASATASATATGTPTAGSSGGEPSQGNVANDSRRTSDPHSRAGMEGKTEAHSRLVHGHSGAHTPSHPHKNTHAHG